MLRQIRSGLVKKRFYDKIHIFDACERETHNNTRHIIFTSIDRFYKMAKKKKMFGVLKFIKFILVYLKN